MDRSIILEILGLLEATPAVLVVAGIGFAFSFIVLAAIVFLCRWLIKLSEKYQILNANHLVLWSIVAPEALKWHHTGEYHIDIKSLVDLCEKMNKQSD